MRLHSLSITNANQFIRTALALMLVFFPVVVLIQTLTQAYSNDIGATQSDAAAHYITGLMIHDYVAQGFPDRPLAFAQAYYLHYPKVAFGVWPPLLHAIEALWMLVFSPSHVSVLLLMGLITALTAATLWAIAEYEAGAALGLGAGLLFLLTPAVMAATVSIMPDALVGLLSLWCMISFAKFVETRQNRWAHLFALLATLSALTKANGLALALLPGLTVLFTRQWDLLRNSRFWIASLASVIVTLPWNYFLWRFVRSSLEVSVADVNLAQHSLYYVQTIFRQLGFAITLLFLVGLYVKVLSQNGRP